ncbi:MAG TPA: PmoA family protein [Actinoplanes sp.]
MGGVPVATYVDDPLLDIRLAPRPYLHPVRTLAGTVVTDELCFDHPWHMGASLTMADVNGTNLWGGRTFVRDEGYVWQDDHGRIRHDVWLPATDGFAEQLLWCDGDGHTLLTERREVAATPAALGWELSFRYALTAPPSHGVSLGSPATNGRTGGAGYGGFFWRFPPDPATAFAADGSDPHGSAAAWVALTAADSYTLVFRGLQGKDRWFVRTSGYVGVCAALAFETPLVIPPGETESRHVRVLVADGTLTPREITEALTP